MNLPPSPAAIVYGDDGRTWDVEIDAWGCGARREWEPDVLDGWEGHLSGAVVDLLEMSSLNRPLDILTEWGKERIVVERVSVSDGDPANGEAAFRGVGPGPWAAPDPRSGRQGRTTTRTGGRSGGR